MIRLALALLLADVPAPTVAPAATPASTVATPAATSTAASDASAETQALFTQAMADYQADKCDAAMPSLKTLVAAGYHSSEAALALRDCYQKVYGEKAIATLEAEVKANPGDAVAHDDLGCFYLLARRFDEAQKELTAALQLDPHNLDARLNLAFWYAQVGQSRAAIDEHLSILKEDPANKRSLTELCYLIAERENDAKRAEPYCAQAAAGQESNEMVGVSLGLVRMRAGDLDGAETAFQTVLAANPGANTARTFYGVARLQRGDYAAAEASFDDVLARDPNDTDARLGLARTYQAKKEFAKAVGEYKAAYHQKKDGMVLGALVKAYLQEYFLGVIGLLLGLMALLLWRYLNVKTPVPPSPGPAAA